MASVGRKPMGTNKPIPGAVSNPVAEGNPVDPPIQNAISSPKVSGDGGFENGPIPGAVSNPHP